MWNCQKQITVQHALYIKYQLFLPIAIKHPCLPSSKDINMEGKWVSVMLYRVNSKQRC